MTETHDAAEQWIILPGTTIAGEVETFSVDFLIRNRNGSQARTLNGVVDTGASYTVIPAQILDELGIEREETKAFSFADGSRRELPIAWTEWSYKDRAGMSTSYSARTAAKSCWEQWLWRLSPWPPTPNIAA